MILTSSWFLYLFLFFSTLYATSNIFFLYLIHARFLLHLWFTRSLKKDWSLCSVARQFLLRVASNLHSAIQLTSVAEHKTWMWIEQITFLTLFLFASSLSRCGQQSLNKFFLSPVRMSTVQYKLNSHVASLRCSMQLCEEEVQTKTRKPNNRSSSDQRRWKKPKEPFSKFMTLNSFHIFLSPVGEKQLYQVR